MIKIMNKGRRCRKRWKEKTDILILIIKLWIKYRFNNKNASAVLSKRASTTNLSSLATPMTRGLLKMGLKGDKTSDLVSSPYLMCK
jgi:hypothetical protein